MKLPLPRLLPFLILLTCFWPSAAHAHTEAGQAAGFVSGFHHPWSGWDHMLAMIAVGIWGAQLRAPAIWLLPVTFPLVMAVGGFFGLIGVPLPGVEVGVALAAVVLGIMVLLEARPALSIAAVIVGIFGLFHGHAHGTELPAGQSGTLYSMGFVLATGCLHGLGIALGTFYQMPVGRIALRGAGAAIAVAGAFFTWQALA